MPLPLTGAVSVTSGSDEFTWTGVPLTPLNCVDGAAIVVNGLAYFLAERIDTTHGRFTRIYAEATDANRPAEIEQISPDQVATATLNKRASDLFSELEILGPNWDRNVPDLPARADYDDEWMSESGRPFAVLVSNIGDGTAAVYSKASAVSADWGTAAPWSGPVGPMPEVTVGTVTTGDPGTSVIITPTPTVDGVELDFIIPAGEGFSPEGNYDSGAAYAKGDVTQRYGSSWIATQAVPTGNAPPTLPTTSNAYWQLLARRGTDGAIDGVTPFWTTRLGADADAAAALAGLGVSTFMRTVLDDADAATARATLGSDSAGNLIAGIIANARLPDRLTNGAIPNVNYNLALEAGFYGGAGDGGTNSPPGSARFGWLLVTGLGGLRVTQIAGYDKELYWRGTVDSGSTWSAWESLVPTYGSNANGNFVRFPGGFQICTYNWTDSAATPSAFGNIWLGDTLTWTFPAAFAAAPAAGGMFKGSSSRKWVTGGGTGATGTQMQIQTVAGIGTGAASNTAGLYAFGLAA